MRLLLRNMRTGQYLQSAELWTESRKQALTFHSTAQAIGFATEFKLLDVEICWTLTIPSTISGCRSRLDGQLPEGLEPL